MTSVRAPRAASKSIIFQLPKGNDKVEIVPIHSGILIPSDLAGITSLISAVHHARLFGIVMAGNDVILIVFLIRTS